MNAARPPVLALAGSACCLPRAPARRGEAERPFDTLTLEQRASRLIMKWTLSRNDNGYALRL